MDSGSNVASWLPRAAKLVLGLFAVGAAEAEEEAMDSVDAGTLDRLQNFGLVQVPIQGGVPLLTQLGEDVYGRIAYAVFEMTGLFELGEIIEEAGLDD